MSLVRNAGTIGALTAISRVFGFARDMLLARLLGAGLAADAFQLAFVLPNTFRRLFAEGAFSVAFVPLYARTLYDRAHGDGTGADGTGGEAAAARFAADVLAVFVWTLAIVSVLAMAAMPGIVWLLARDYTGVPGKFALAVMLSRITFPYLFLVALVALLSGLLNARARFAPGAFAPVLLNLVLIAGIAIGFALRRAGHDDRGVAIALAVSVTIGGMAQLAYLIQATRREGVAPALAAPRLTPQVRRLAVTLVPATLGAGIYQASQFVDTFFATSLPQGSLTLLRYADRLIQMPLGVVGIALGTAILPMLTRHIQAGDADAAKRVQANAVEAAGLLTLPAATALAICAPAFVTALFVGGRMTPGDGATMTGIVVALACGLPAYVLVKVFQPAFFSRDDTRTPMRAAMFALAVNVALNIAVVPRLGIVGLAGATALCATLNAATLAWVLRTRGWFRIEAVLLARIARQIVASAAMAATLWWLEPRLGGAYAGGVAARVGALTALLAAGLASFLAAAWISGALDKRTIAQLRRGAAV